MIVRFKSNARGFTLIEMVVVISLILILLSISLPMYSRYIQRSKEAKLHSNLTTLNKVIEAYSLDIGSVHSGSNETSTEGTAYSSW